MFRIGKLRIGDLRVRDLWIVSLGEIKWSRTGIRFRIKGLRIVDLRIGKLRIGHLRVRMFRVELRIVNLRIGKLRISHFRIRMFRVGNLRIVDLRIVDLRIGKLRISHLRIRVFRIGNLGIMDLRVNLLRVGMLGIGHFRIHILGVEDLGVASLRRKDGRRLQGVCPQNQLHRGRGGNVNGVAFVTRGVFKHDLVLGYIAGPDLESMVDSRRARRRQEYELSCFVRLSNTANQLYGLRHLGGRFVWLALRYDLLQFLGLWLFRRRSRIRHFGCS